MSEPRPSASEQATAVPAVGDGPFTPEPKGLGLGAAERLVFEQTPDALVLMHPDGKIAYWNPSSALLFGYTAEEVVGRTLSEFLVPADRLREEDELLRGAIASGCATYESLRRRKDGALLYVDITTKVIRDERGEIEYLLSTKKDVTDLKVLRDAKLVEAKLRDLLESSPDAVVMSNSMGRIVLSNSHAEELFAYTHGELRGKPVEVLLPERYRAAHVGYRSGYFGQPRVRSMGVGLELFGLRKDGVEFPVEISLSPLQTEEGVLVFSAIRDISYRKRIENDLSEKNIELQRAADAKNRFLANMSHELRTPLNAIIGFTGTLLMKLPGPLNQEQDKQLSTILYSAEHLLSLINDLLDLAKIEAGKVELKLEPLSCTDLIREVASTLTPLAREKGLYVEVDLPADEVSIHSDHRALSQILINLTNNAIKFTTTGGVTLSLRRQSTGEASSYEIHIRDTGCGIRQEDQAKLFQAFSQLDSSSTRRHEGTGLGLHLSQKLAELLGAHIRFESEYGRGSTFVLALGTGH